MASTRMSFPVYIINLPCLLCREQPMRPHLFARRRAWAPHSAGRKTTNRVRSATMDLKSQMKSEIRDGMRVDWDTPIAMDDGLVLRADVFRPLGDAKYPVILSYGPYAKGLAFQDGYKGNWARLTKAAPEVLQGSRTNIRTGSWSIRRNGCRAATSVYASTRAAPAARRAFSMSGRRAKRRISTVASNGPERSPGAAARSASTAFPTTQ